MAIQPIPAFVFDDCRVYQQDHANFVSWLGHSAAKCGLFPKVKSTTKVAKAKSARARTRTKYLLALNEYVPFAQAVASAASKAKVDIDPSVIRCLRRIVSKRKECAEWYGKVVPADDGHEFMIKVLEEVIEIFLAQRLVSAVKKKPNTKSAQDGTDPLRNAFESLNVHDEGEETDTNGLQDVDGEAKWALVVAEKSMTIYEALEPCTDVWFHIFNFFRLCEQLRVYIKEIWIDYQAGNVDLVAASVTTDSAIGILEKAEDDLVKYLDDSGQLLDKIGYSRTGMALLDQLGKHLGEPPFKKRGENIGLHLELQDHAKYIYLTTYLLMMEFLEQQHNIREPVVQDLPEMGMFLDLSTNRTVLSGLEQSREDRIILMEILPDIKMVEINKWDVKRWPAQDKFLTGFRAATQTNVLMTWHVFAAQVFLDVVHILRVEVFRPFATLKLAATAAEEHLDTLKKNKKFLDPIDLAGVQEVGEIALELIIEYVKEDPFPIWYKDFGFDALDGSVRDHQFKRNPYGLLSKHPTLCGLMMFRLQMLIQDVGVGLDFYSGALVSTAYLYNEARNQGLCGQWKDMEKMIKFYGENKILFGSRPANAIDSCKRFNLYFGMSATELVPVKSRQKKVSTKQRGTTGLDMRKRSSGRRKLSNPSLITKMFLGRYCPEYFEHYPIQDSGGIDLQSIEMLVQASADRSGNYAGIAQPKQNGDQKTFNWKAFSKKLKISHTLSHIEFLNTLRASLVAERDVLAFSNINMHIRCTKVLSSICQTVGPAFENYPGIQLSLVDRKGNIVGFDIPNARYRIADPILQAAAARTKFLGLYPDAEMPQGLDLFGDTAKILQQAVTTAGDAESVRITKLHDAFHALCQIESAKLFKNNFENTLPTPRTTPDVRVLGTHRPTLGEINVLYAHLDKLQGKVTGISALPEKSGGPFMRFYHTQGLLSLLRVFADMAGVTKLKGTASGGGGYRVNEEEWEGIACLLIMISQMQPHLADAIKQAIWYQVYELIDAVNEIW